MSGDHDPIDFLPDDYVEKKTQGRSNILAIGLFLTVMVAVIGVYFLKDREFRQVIHERDQIAQKIADQGEQLRQLSDCEKEKQKMMAKAEIAAVLLERVPRSILLRELALLMPKKVYLLEFTLKRQDLPPAQRPKADPNKPATPGENETKPAPANVHVELVATAPTDDQVASFMSGLAKSPIFQDVNLSYSEEFKFRDEVIRRFKVELNLNPQIDARTLQNKS